MSAMGVRELDRRVNRRILRLVAITCPLLSASLTSCTPLAFVATDVRGLLSPTFFAPAASPIPHQSPPVASPANSLRYNALVRPVRLVDTRDGRGLDGEARALQDEEVLTVSMVAIQEVPPTNVSVVSITITAVDSAFDGYITAYACGPKPPTSNLNARAGTTVANVADVALSSARTFCIFVQRTTHLVVDLVGWQGLSGSLFNPLVTRIFETGDTLPGFEGGDEKELTGFDLLGVAEDATAVTINIKATNSLPGFITAYGCGFGRPDTSNLNPQPERAVDALATVPLGTNRRVCIYSHASTDLIVDLFGWWGSTGNVGTPIPPTRVRDTRERDTAASLTMPIGAPLELHLRDNGLVPVEARAITANVTSVQPIDVGFVIAYPCASPRPFASNLDTVVRTLPSPGYPAVANQVLSAIDASGDLCLYTNRLTDLVVDVMSWWSGSA